MTAEIRVLHPDEAAVLDHVAPGLSIAAQAAGWPTSLR